MPQLELTLSNLKELDLGKVDALFRRAVQSVVADMVGRPNDTSKRVITVDFAFTPISADGVVDEARMEAMCKVKIAPQRTREYSIGIGPGKAVFSADSPDNVRQMTLSDAARKANIEPDEQDEEETEEQ